MHEGLGSTALVEQPIDLEFRGRICIRRYLGHIFQPSGPTREPKRGTNLWTCDGRGGTLLPRTLMDSPYGRDEVLHTVGLALHGVLWHSSVGSPFEQPPWCGMA